MKEPRFTQKTLFKHSGFEHVSVGKMVRALRRSSGFSIKALAEKSGLAINTLSLIENERTSPNVNTLEQLARALEVPIASFFESGDENPDLFLAKLGNRQELRFEGVCIEDCGCGLDDQPMQPLVITLAPGAGRPSESINHSGYEFVYCLSGQIDYYVDGEKYSLNEGDSLTLKAVLPHHWINPGKKPAVYLLVMVPGDTGKPSGNVHFQVKLEND